MKKYVSLSEIYQFFIFGTGKDFMGNLGLIVWKISHFPIVAVRIRNAVFEFETKEHGELPITIRRDQYG